MASCLLCTEEHRRGNYLTQELNNGFTVENAIRQYFTSQQQLLSGDLTDASICMICYKTLRNFYEFTSPIDGRFPLNFEIIEEIIPKPETETDDFIEEEHIEEHFIVEELEEVELKAKKSIHYSDFYNNFRRAHPSKDEEGEAKIQRLVEMKCHECHRYFDRFLDVMKHYRESHPNIPGYLICCNKKFTKRPALLEHVEFHDKSIIYKCEMCEKTFKGKAILRNHVRTFHINLPGQCVCNMCGKLFSNKYTLKTHMKNHLVDLSRQFECYICKKTAKNLEKLQHHFKYRHDPAHQRSTICHICSKRVTRLDIHVAAIHPTEPIERVRCEICGHNLKITSLKAHMRKHQDTTFFQCELCNTVLKNRNTLACHMKRIHGEGKFNCEHCGKKFHQKGHLQDHIACQHTGAFLHKCRVEGCTKEFRNIGRMRLHVKRMHSFEYETKFKPIYLRNNVEVVEYIDGGGGEDELEEVVMEYEDGNVEEFIKNEG